MKQLKKTILTLVALLAISTGAWAEGYYDININFNPVYNSEFTNFMCHVMGPDMPSGTLGLWIDKSYTGSFRVENGMCSTEISPALDAGDHTWYAEFTPEGGGEKSTEQRSFTIDQDFAYVYIDDPEQSSIEMGVGESRNFRGHVDGPESSEVNISSSNDNVAKFRASSSYPYGFEGYIDAVGAGTATITVSFAGNKNYKAAQSKTLTVTVLAPAATGPEVAWDKAKNSGTFKMPGGNVTLEPEYYPQAALTAAPTAINDVPATTDGAIVNAGTVKNIGETTKAQGTVMYYVSPTALDDAALLALAADQWTADVPTAADLAQGQAYVYYYVRGNDSDNDDENFSDGDILAANALTVTIAAAPTYAVTFADDIDEPDKWTASPAAGVTKGTEVKVTYTGTKKVIGVKAEKKSTTTTLDNTTTAWTAGTYAVPAGGLTYSDAITVSGDVTLTLTDGETLTLNKGISLAEGATLTVEGNGTMNINGTNGNSSSTVAGSGMMCFKSGTLVATGGNGHVGNDLGQYGMNGGISHGGSAINGSLTLEGGNVTATGGNGGNAGGANSINCATGGDGGSAITGNVIINGGSWTANDGSNGTLLPGGNSNKAGTGGKAVAGTVTDNRN